MNLHYPDRDGGKRQGATGEREEEEAAICFLQASGALSPVISGVISQLTTAHRPLTLLLQIFFFFLPAPNSAGKDNFL